MKKTHRMEFNHKNRSNRNLKLKTIKTRKRVNKGANIKNKLKISKMLYKKKRLNTLFGKILTINQEILFLNINSSRILKTKYWLSKDKMLKFLSFVQELFMAVDKILSILCLKQPGFNNLRSFPIWEMELT